MSCIIDKEDQHKGGRDTFQELSQFYKLNKTTTLSWLVNKTYKQNLPRSLVTVSATTKLKIVLYLIFKHRVVIADKVDIDIPGPVADDNHQAEDEEENDEVG